MLSYGALESIWLTTKCHPVVIAGHNDTRYFCVLCGETFLTNEEFAIHTTDYEESQYPCASCDEYFRKSTDLTDHVYTDYEKIWI